jgi:hypothetical protein
MSPAGLVWAWNVASWMTWKGEGGARGAGRLGLRAPLAPTGNRRHGLDNTTAVTGWEIVKEIMRD